MKLSGEKLGLRILVSFKSTWTWARARESSSQLHSLIKKKTPPAFFILLCISPLCTVVQTKENVAKKPNFKSSQNSLIFLSMMRVISRNLYLVLLWEQTIGSREYVHSCEGIFPCTSLTQVVVNRGSSLPVSSYYIITNYMHLLT